MCNGSYNLYYLYCLFYLFYLYYPKVPSTYTHTSSAQLERGSGYERRGREAIVEVCVPALYPYHRSLHALRHVCVTRGRCSGCGGRSGEIRTLLPLPLRCEGKRCCTFPAWCPVQPYQF